MQVRYHTTSTLLQVRYYRERLIKLKLLPLMMTLEFSDIVFFIKLINNPTLNFNISDFLTFTSSKTRSSNFKLQHIRSSHNLTRNFYFNRFPCLWNALPPINIINCPINMIKSTIKSYFWLIFLTILILISHVSIISYTSL